MQKKINLEMAPEIKQRKPQMMKGIKMKLMITCLFVVTYSLSSLAQNNSCISEMLKMGYYPDKVAETCRGTHGTCVIEMLKMNWYPETAGATCRHNNNKCVIEMLKMSWYPETVAQTCKGTKGTCVIDMLKMGYYPDTAGNTCRKQYNDKEYEN